MLIFYIVVLAQPSTRFFGQRRSRYVILPSAEAKRVITLHCDIQPGAVRGRYSVTWFRYRGTTDELTRMSETSFNLTRNIWNDHDSEYKCDVAINHDGITERSYEGARIHVKTAGWWVYQSFSHVYTTHYNNLSQHVMYI